jgi:hypothetical protein
MLNPIDTVESDLMWAAIVLALVALLAIAERAYKVRSARRNARLRQRLNCSDNIKPASPHTAEAAPRPAR